MQICRGILSMSRLTSSPPPRHSFHIITISSITVSLLKSSTALKISEKFFEATVLRILSTLLVFLLCFALLLFFLCFPVGKRLHFINLTNRVKRLLFLLFVCQFKMRIEQFCQVACRVTLDAESARSFKEKIDDQYRVNM